MNIKKAPLCKGRDALRKYAGGIFLAKAGSKLCLRPGPKAPAEQVREPAEQTNSTRLTPSPTDEGHRSITHEC